MAKLLIVNSSYRMNSNSTELSGQVATGAIRAGHEVTTVNISHMRIEPCRGCNACMQALENNCVVQDDMQPLYSYVREADILILASPIYWFTFCGQIKQFIDRCYAVASKIDANGKSLFSTKTIGAVMTYGDTDPYVSGCVNAIHTLRDICNYTGAKWAGAVYGTAEEPGDMRQNAPLLEQARVFGQGL